MTATSASTSPATHFPVRTHEVALTESTRRANARFFTGEDEVPTAAYTMGVGTVMAAAAC